MFFPCSCSPPCHSYQKARSGSFLKEGRNKPPSLRKINRNIQEYDLSQDLAALEEIKQHEDLQSVFSRWTALLVDTVERKKVICSAGAMYAQKICGILFFYVYGVVFAQAIGISQPFTIQLITNILQIFSVGASVLSGNRVPRRNSLFITTWMIFGAFIVIGESEPSRVSPRLRNISLSSFRISSWLRLTMALDPWPIRSPARWRRGPTRTKSCQYRLWCFT